MPVFIDGVETLDAPIFGGAAKFANGTVALPSITFTSDPDTGLYRIGTNELGVAAGGALAARFGTTGVTIGGLGAPAPDSKLHVWVATAGVVTADATSGLTVEGSGNTSISILTPAANIGFILFGSPTAANRGQIYYDHSLDTLNFATGATNRMTLGSTTLTIFGTWTFENASKLYPVSDNAYDIGSAGNRIRSLFTATAIFADADQEVLDATLVNSTELTCSVVAGGKYAFRAMLFMLNDGAAEGIKLALGGTATITDLKAQISVYDDTLNALAAFGRVTALLSSVGAGISAGANFAIIEGAVTINAAGTFLVQFAQNAAGAGAGVHLEIDSSLNLDRLV